MTNKLQGKIAVVTAAGQGIGRASAVALARAGATVWATDVNAEALASLDGEANVTTAPLDVLDAGAVTAFFAKVGRVDVLFNCAGVVHGGTVLDITDKDLDFAFDLNVRAMIRTIQAVLPGMLERRDGSIINMASIASSAVST